MEMAVFVLCPDEPSPSPSLPANRLPALISPYLPGAAAAPAFGASSKEIQLPQDAVVSLKIGKT